MFKVIVVGGGPVGMLTANELALHSIPSVVIESRTTVSGHPKAGTYHARAISTLGRRGILTLPRLTEDPNLIISEPFQFAGYPWLTLSTHAINGPVMLGMAQANLEKTIQDVALSNGVTILRGQTVKKIIQKDDRVELEVSNNDTDEIQILTSDYVVGADGGRSIVRESGNFDVQEYQPTMRALLGLARFPHPEQLSPGWYQTSRGWVLFNHNSYGDSRVIVFEFDGPVDDRHKEVTSQELTEALERVMGHQVDLEDVHGLGRFSDFSRIAGSYRDRRLLLAGDAAHIHYPLGGQGLNTGISDAINLGWKLAAVTLGQADDRLLDTYSEERQTIGQNLIDNTRLQSQLMNPSIDSDPLRNFMQESLRLPEMQKMLGDTINGNAISYPTDKNGSAPTNFVGSYMPNLLLELKDQVQTDIATLGATGRFVCLVDSSLNPESRVLEDLDFMDVVLVKGIPFDYPQVIVVRPDGYIAWAGEPRDVESGLVRTLEEYFALKV